MPATKLNLWEAATGDLPLWEAAMRATPPGVSPVYLLALNFARHPWLAQIALRLLWRPASRRCARRASTHTVDAPCSDHARTASGMFIDRSKAQRSEP